MGPNLPSFNDAVNAASNGSNIGNDVANLAPLATNWHGAQTGVNAQQVMNNPVAPNPGVLSKFTGFIGNIFSDIGHIGAGAVSWLGHTTVDLVEAPIKFGNSMGNDIQDYISLKSISARNDQELAQLQAATNAYHSGRMSSQDYTAALKGLRLAMKTTMDMSHDTGKRVTLDTGETTKAGLDTVSTLVTILTAGFGSAPAAAVSSDGITSLATKSAGDWLASQAAKPFLDSTSEFISKVASQPEVFKALSPEAQAAFQLTTAEVLATGTKMTAPQIARATAANLALKYPLYYAATSSTAGQLYNELDKKQYGDAVRTLAFNAALLLSGGPIGQAMKYGGKALSGLSGKTFGKTSFWDELSKYYGDGTPGGFRDAVVKATANMSDIEKTQYLRDLSAVEATNVAAVGTGAAAANRVATGMTANEGINLRTVSHDEALKNMVDYATAQRLADETAQTAGLGKVAVGRVDARALNEISANLSRVGLPAPGEIAAPVPDVVDMSKAPDFLQPTGTPDALAALKQKALKYKSADEFVKSHNPIYHGTNADLTDITQLQSGRQRGEYSKGTRSIFASENPELAGKYGKNVLEGRNTGKVLDTTKLGDPHDPNKMVVPKEFSDYKTNPILDATDRRVLENSYFKGGTPSNIVIDHKPNIQEYFRSKGYSTIQIPRGSDVPGPATEMTIIDPSKIQTKQQLSDLYHQAHAEAKASNTIDSPSPASTVGNDGQSMLAGQHTDVAMQHTNGAGEESSATQARLQAWDKLKQQNPGQAWANNANFDTQIKSLITKHEDASGLDTAIRGIKAQFTVDGFPKSAATKLSKMGYIPIKPVVNEAPFKEGAGVITSKFAQEGDVWTKAVQPLPILGSIGSLITHLGLSPQNATQRVYQMYNQALADNLSKLEISRDLAIMHDKADSEGADMVIKRLSDFAHNPTRGGITMAGAKIRPPITDLRQLTTNDIMAALEVSKGDAKQVASALMDSMLQVPLQVRGLGDRIVDLNYKFNPTAKAYARIQGAARFSWNPFFQAKLAYKTESLSQLEAHGKFPTIAGTNKIMSIIFPEHYAKLDEIRSTLRDNGIFDEKSKLGGVVSGEAVNDAGVGSANLTHKLIPSQEISIAGLVATQADKMGLSVEDFVKNFPSDVRDTVQTIAQYDRRSQFLNSPLARTLNLAFFPFRFETKVAMVMAKSLATTSTMTQFAVIKGVYNGSTFLKSPEGQVWYSQNADVIKLLTYFTPVTTLSYFANALGGKPDSVGAFGELGGLPLGWIPQLLDAEGLTHITQSAYLEPKTGNEIPGYVPATDKGALLVAIQDLIGQLFTYPGAELGLPSKTSITRNIAMGVTGGTRADLAKAPQLPLSPDQQTFQQAVQAANPQATSRKSTTTPQQLNKPVVGQVVPAGNSPLTTPIPKKIGGSGSSKKKKADFTPELMPGQSQLGVIPGVN